MRKKRNKRSDNGKHLQKLTQVIKEKQIYQILSHKLKKKKKNARLQSETKKIKTKS